MNREANQREIAHRRVRFLQPADSFVRDLVFTLVSNRLEAVNQTVADTVYTIVLTKQ